MASFVYIMASKPMGTLYVGVTNDVVRRAWEHREGVLPGFTKRYRIARLVYFKEFPDVRDAIQREKNLKHWSRAWKVSLIEAANPDWHDLYPTLAGP